MRLIDGDELLSTVKSLPWDLRKPSAEISRQLFIETVKEAPTIDPVKHGRWISVEDRLPEIKEHHVSDTVLVWCANEERMAFTELEETFFGGLIFGIERPLPDDDERPEVTHWMQLPEPPTGAMDTDE